LFCCFFVAEAGLRFVLYFWEQWFLYWVAVGRVDRVKGGGRGGGEGGGWGRDREGDDQAEKPENPSH